MMNKVIRPEQFEGELKKALAKYGDEVHTMVVKEASRVSRETVSELKGSAPAGGRYARGWSHKAQGNRRTSYSDTVYNRTDYQLTHLLEKPHETRGGGHYPKNVDYTGTLAKIEEEKTNKFMEEVIAKL